jgi:hypothetical protein
MIRRDSTGKYGPTAKGEHTGIEYIASRGSVLLFLARRHPSELGKLMNMTPKDLLRNELDMVG